MCKRLISNIFILLISFAAHAQKQNNIWAFGEKAGLDFNTSPVSAFHSESDAKMDQLPYYISSVCDKDGKLMFYTDGWNFWNRDHLLMTKYRNWWIWSAKIIPLVFPHPGNDSLFYVFGIGDGINPYDLNYVTTMMHHSGDIEQVVYPRPTDPNTFYTKLLANCSLGLTGTAHCNQRDYWVVTYAQNGFYSFLVTPSGVNPVPVFSPLTLPTIAGRAGTTTQILPLNRSNIKISANSERMVVPMSGNVLAVYNFDNFTGRFSNPLMLHAPRGNDVDDAELSPDGSKLYIAAAGPDQDVPELIGHNIFQMDLDAGNATQIEASAVQLNEVPDLEACTPHVCFLIFRAMQLAPDGKIYIGMRYADQPNIKIDRLLSVIEEPNQPGVRSRFRRSQVDVGLKYLFFGYNYIRSGSFSLKENGIQFRKKTCADEPVDFSLLFSNVDSVRWDFGDPASGINNSSRSVGPSHQYPAAGSYTVHALIYKRCITDTATATVNIQQDKKIQIPASIKDTVMCVGSELKLNVKTATSTAYVWENGLIYPDRIINEAGKYRVTVMNDCSVAQKEFTVSYQQCPCNVFVPSAFTPNGDGLNDIFKPVSTCYARDYKMKIFSRYGNVIFESNNISDGWNGRSGAHDLTSGVYVWMMQYRNPNTRELIQKNGTITLIR